MAEKGKNYSIIEWGMTCPAAKKEWKRNMKKQRKYLLIKPDGTKTIVVPEDGEDQLRFLQRQVGGYIESILTRNPIRQAYVNEEGWIHDEFEPNKTAVPIVEQVVAGNLVVVLQPRDEGKTLWGIEV